MTRQEAIAVLKMVEAHGLADKAKQMAIDALTQPEIIRCKDCKYFYDNSCDSLELYYCTIDPYCQPETSKCDFCSRGERR